MTSATADWVTPPTRPELIENLVSGVGACYSARIFEYLNRLFEFLPLNIDRYNPSNVGILEDYLYHQIRSQEYDCLANLAILKLYAIILSFFSDTSLNMTDAPATSSTKISTIQMLSSTSL